MIAACPAAVFASIDPSLQAVFDTRTDLQSAFNETDYKAIPGSAAGFLIDLEDWAKQYGWREHPELVAYGPGEMTVPTRFSKACSEPFVTSEAYVVLDRQTGQILSAKNPTLEWPIASLTKLVTVDVVLDQQVSFSKQQSVSWIDDVGGAKLYVTSGDVFSVQDLLYATLVGSANNAANALARSTGLSKEVFVAEMNSIVQELNLSHTTFVDPTGIEIENVSTPWEMARIAQHVFEHRDVRRYTSTAVRYITDKSQGTTKKMTSTNWMLWKPEYDDIYVMSGKTGYLEESGWNLVVSLRPELLDEEQEVLIVLFGADSRAESFVDARALAEWAWENHAW